MVGLKDSFLMMYINIPLRFRWTLHLKSFLAVVYNVEGICIFAHSRRICSTNYLPCHTSKKLSWQFHCLALDICKWDDTCAHKQKARCRVHRRVGGEEGERCCRQEHLISTDTPGTVSSRTRAPLRWVICNHRLHWPHFFQLSQLFFGGGGFKYPHHQKIQGRVI